MCSVLLCVIMQEVPLHYVSQLFFFPLCGWNQQTSKTSANMCACMRVCGGCGCAYIRACVVSVF